MTDPAHSIGAHGMRKMAHGLNSAVALALAVALAGMVNYLSARHFVRADWSRSHFYRLSEKTLNLLGTIKDPVDVIIFFQKDHALYDDVDNLLREYAYACPNIRLERVDPDRDLARTEELARRFKVADLNVVVFDQGGRSKFVTASDLAEMDYSQVMQTGAAEQSGFKGEQAFSSALLSITQGRTPTVYFFEGHGERDVDSQDRKGFSTLKQEILRDNITVKKFLPGIQSAIPADADAVVIASPRSHYSDAELGILRSYLDKDGRVLVLLDSSSRSGLEPLLEEWGVGVGNTMVVDPSRTLSGSDIFIRDYRPHAITKNINKQTSVFYLPRAVEPLSSWTNQQDRADKPAVVSLCQSSPDSWAETDVEQRPVRYDKGRDVPGPISLAVAAERGPLQGLDVTVRPARLVVFGDADFVSNIPLTGGNYDFFMSALNWLLERDELLAIAPKPIQETRLLIDATQLTMLFWALIAGIPGVMATLGVAVWIRRRA